MRIPSLAYNGAITRAEVKKANASESSSIVTRGFAIEIRFLRTHLLLYPAIASSTLVAFLYRLLVMGTASESKESC